VRAVNLIPVDQRGGSGPAAGRSEGGAYAVLVLLAGLAVLALLYGTARHEISTRRARATSLTAQTQLVQARAATLAPYASFLTLHDQRQQAVSELAQSRFDWAHAFHELGRVLPRGASISSLSGTVGAASSTSAATRATGTTGSVVATSATPPGSVPVFALGGCATSQAVVAQTLNRLRLMDGVSAVTLQSSAIGASGGGLGGSGGGAACSGGDFTFTVQITFDPLPAATPGTSTGGAG
jgi:Tfp pilus assembly protein PilN